MCNCLEEVVDFVVNQAGNLGSSSWNVRYKALQAASDVLICLLENQFDVESNKAQQVSSAEQTGGTLIWAPEVDTSFYIDVGVATGACVLYGQCDLIIELFVSYFQDTINKVSSGLEDIVISKVMAPLQTVEQKVNDVLSSIENLPQKIQTEIDRCASSVSLPQNLKDFNEDIKEISSFYDDLKDMITKVQYLVDTLESASSILEGDYLQRLKKLIEQLDFPDFKDPISFLLSSGGVLEVFNDLKSFVTKIGKFSAAVQSIQDTGYYLLDDLDRLPGSCQFDSINSEIQSIRKDVGNLDQDVRSLVNFEITDNSLQVGLVTYNNWFSISLDLPCVKMETLTKSSNGFTDSLKYPKFYRCPFSATVPMPNEHLPYLRVKI